jgi:hypothetical protein
MNAPEAALSTDTEEEMDVAVQGNVVERQAANRDAVTTFGNGARTLLLVIIGQNAVEVEAERRRREDAAIDAEDILTQAEEANALDPVG